jgi:hypothetical protein
MSGGFTSGGIAALTGFVPSSSTIEGLCAPLSANDQVIREISRTDLLQEDV